MADLITKHTGTKVYIEQTIPGLPRVDNEELSPKGGRMDVVFDLRGSTYNIDTEVVTLFSSNAGLISDATARPGFKPNARKKQSLTDMPASI